MHDRPGRSAAWSRWSEAAAARPWTVGVEEELMLLDPGDWSLANRVEDVLDALPEGVAAHAAPETHACVLELRTAPHGTVAEAAAQLGGLRDAVDRTLREELGLRAAVAGMHPFAVREDVDITSDRRYREVEATMRALARREPTMAQHVHVAVPDADAAVRALDGLRGALPVILALSANSPYWHGSDSGFASVRTPVFSMFPRIGIPRRFGRYGEYVATVAAMLRARAIPDPSFLWWDARLQPRLGTVEVRMMDAQSRLLDVAALAALVQCLVRRYAAGGRAYAPPLELLAENRFLAARDGLEARCSTTAAPTAGAPCARRSPSCWRTARRTRASSAARASWPMPQALAADPGYARQRRCAERGGPRALLARLADEYAHPARAMLAAWTPAGEAGL